MDYFIWRIHKTTSMESKVSIYNQRHELRCGLTSSNSQEYSMHYGLYYVQIILNWGLITLQVIRFEECNKGKK